MSDLLIEIYQQCNENLRASDTKRDQVIAFYVVVISLFFSSIDKLGNIKQPISIALVILGLILALVILSFRKWHIVYVNSAIVIQHLIANGIAPSQTAIKNAWDFLIFGQQYANTPIFPKRRHNPLSTEKLTYIAFLLLSFTPLYFLRSDWLMITIHIFYVVVLWVISDLILKNELSAGYLSSWLLRLYLMEDEMRQYKEILADHPDLISNENAQIKIIQDDRQIQEWVNERKNKNKLEGKPVDWASIGVILTDPHIVILRDLVEFPGGRKGSYLRIINQADLRGGQGVVILAEMNKKFLLLHQYRHPTRSWSYEFPRGFGEPGVIAEHQAKKEIHEEVGGESDKLVDLGIYSSNSGLEGNKVVLFYTKLKSVGQPAQEEGIDRILWVSLNELEKMIAEGRITDGFTIAAYTRAKLRGLL